MGPRNRPVKDNIWQVAGSGLTAPEDAAAYLVAFDDMAALIDSGCGRATDLLLTNIESTGVAVECIRMLLLTHCHIDHAGGAAEIRDRLGCTIVAHALDADAIASGDEQLTAADWYGRPMVPCPVDWRLEGDEHLAVGDGAIRVVPIPGHTPGSVAYLTESAGNLVLFGQDVHGPLDPGFNSDRQAYQESLRRLLDLRADVLCEGHYGIFSGQERVAEFIRSFLTS